MIHLQKNVPNWLEAVQRLPLGSLVKAVDQVQELKQVKLTNPGVITCLRHHYDHEQVFGGDYEANKQRARTFFDTFIDGTFMEYAPFVDFIEEWNEYLANSQNSVEIADRIRWATAAADVWKNEYRTRDGLEHIRLVLCNTAIGNWIHDDFAVAANNHDAAIGYHPYTLWQNKQRWEHDWESLSGLWDVMEFDWGIEVDWVFTEAGPFESAVTGWRHDTCLGFDRNLYVEAVRAWMRDVKETPAYKEGRVYGFGLFTTGRTGDVWKHFWTEQPELNMIADMVAEEWVLEDPEPPKPEPPIECRGLPREQYKREYWVLNNNMTEEQEKAVFDFARQEKRTIGWSYDDAGIGDLDNITAVLWNIDENLHQVFLDWYAEHYPGVVVEFRDIVEETFVIQDIVNELPVHETKEYSTRPLTEITALTIHHTVTPSSTPIEQMAEYHVNTRDWPGIGYHYVIKDNGDIYQTNYLTTKSYHAGSYDAPGDENLWSVGIALQGNFTDQPPPQEQLDAARWLVEELKDQFGELEVVPHKHMPGAKTQCPGNTWEEWFDYVAGN
jgi:hypothetical protein